MTYGKEHTEDECDKCLVNVGKANLFKVPFLYQDCNDKSHKDEGDKYRQYWVCKKCFKEV